MRRLLLGFVCSVSLFTSGCGLNPAEAGFGGAALGAGSGAIIGSVIENGDIAKSAGLGALIGFPAGIILSLAADSLFISPSSGKDSTKDFSKEIASNQEQIYDNNLEIQELRRDVSESAPTGNPARHNRDYIFDGETLGNMYR